jgi:hypothetical protein
MELVGLTSEQNTEVVRIDEMADGPEKDKAKAAWCKKHKKIWPSVIYRRNELVAAVMANTTEADWKAVVMNGRYASAKPPY